MEADSPETPSAVPGAARPASANGGRYSSRLFISSPSQQRARRAGDVVLVGLGLVLVGISAVVANRVIAAEEEVGNLVAALPSWAHETFAIGFGLAALFVLWILISALVAKRGDVLRDLLLAGAIAVVVGLLLARLIDDAWPIVFPELGDAAPAPRFPVLRVAVVSAIVAAAGPHLTRPIRRLGWASVILVAVSGLGLGLGLPSDDVGGVGLGIAAAGAVFLLFGSPAGYPDPEQVTAELAGLGLVVTNLHPTPNQTWGTRTLVGEDEEGRQLLVKAYGPDARDAQLMAKVWRSLWYRDTGPSLSFSRLQQVEHEALVILLATRAGVRCPTVLVAATAGDDDAILVTDHLGVQIAEMDPGAISDSGLVAVWEEVAKLHGVAISHGALDTAHVHLDGDIPNLTGFENGSLSATPTRLSTDIAELLVATAGVVGVDRAVQAAKVGVGNEQLSSAVPYIQLAAISPATRRALEEPKALVKAVHAAAVDATGVEEPEPVKLRRVDLRSLVVTGLIALFAYFLIQQLAGIDFQEVWDSIKDANWAWVSAAFVVAQLILIPNATSMMAAVSAPIPLRPTIILQSSIQFIGVAVPSMAGRVATQIAYLRKFGVPPVTAVTQGGLDSFTGFLVQVAILIVALVFGDVAFNVDTDTDLDWGLILGIAVLVVVAGGIVVWTVKSLRARLLSALKEVVGALRVLIKEPKRSIVLFASNFGAQLVLAITMWLTVRAFGDSISMATSLVIVVAAVLLGGLAPTPGGVGVVEAALAAGLVAAGLSSADASAAALTYRLVTFALPPIWGFYALRWLDKNDYL